MSKLLLLVLGTLILSTMAIDTSQAKRILRQDECTNKAMEILEPEIQAKFDEISKV